MALDESSVPSPEVHTNAYSNRSTKSYLKQAATEWPRLLRKLVKTVTQQYEEGNIDEEEHDLVIEAIEEVDPEGRSFPKLTDDSDAFYDEGDMPDSPELKLGKRKNLDDLMKSR